MILVKNSKKKKVIVNTNKRTGNYISSVFTRGKIDGSYRTSFNLKNFKKYFYVQDILKWYQYKT